jgi:glycosyltransferase involved in cell wall biosynthesis
MNTFRDRIKKEFADSFTGWLPPPNEKSWIKADLHCHDLNSNRADEKCGRILNVSETWLPTDKLLSILKDNRCDAITITNHNNARSCYELKDRGIDVLTAAEFDCTMPEERAVFHVLAYGFTPEEEKKLYALRKNIYRFAEYTAERDIPTILAHPLFFRIGKQGVSDEILDKLLLTFERFEVVNGQRDSYQNLVVNEWLQKMTPEMIERAAKRVGITPIQFCRNGYTKKLCGGSDDHMGIFAGSTGTYIKTTLPSDKREKMAASEQLLEGIKNGELRPYGRYQDLGKLSVSLLDYFCQGVVNYRDPGLLRILLHKGESGEKLGSFLISNAVAEIKRHKYTTRFLESFHNALHGKPIGFIDSLFCTKDYKPIINSINKMANSRRANPEEMDNITEAAISEMHQTLSNIVVSRTSKALNKVASTKWDKEKISHLLEKFEISSQLRNLFATDTKVKQKDISNLNVSKLLDDVSFPLLALSVINGTRLAGSRAQTHNTAFIEKFAERHGIEGQPSRLLWLTDTFGDGNGISVSLRHALEEIQKYNYPVDMLVCSESIKDEPHLRVLKPLAEFPLPGYESQIARVPDLLAIHKIVTEGGYDRVIASTELCMGAVALYIKQAFNVPAFFFLHTDWLEFAKLTLSLDKSSLARMRRMLRAFYRSFDGIFTLNTEHRDWLTSQSMLINPQKVHSTNHWINSALFYPEDNPKRTHFPVRQISNPVFLYVGRLSKEKGVLDLPQFLQKVREVHPDASITIAGEGPCEEQLRKELPDATFCGWKSQEQLRTLYSTSDMLIFPSQFDAFGRTVIEALACALPVCAFDCKGPADIVEDGICGILDNSIDELAKRASYILQSPHLLNRMKSAAFERSFDYRNTEVFGKLMKTMGIDTVLIKTSTPIAAVLRSVPECTATV